MLLQQKSSILSKTKLHKEKTSLTKKLQTLTPIANLDWLKQVLEQI